jgi:hypothetical protein
MSEFALKKTQTIDSLVSMIVDDNRSSRSWFYGHDLPTLDQLQGDMTTHIADGEPEALQRLKSVDSSTYRQSTSPFSTQVTVQPSNSDETLFNSQCQVEVDETPFCCSKHKQSQGAGGSNPEGPEVRSAVHQWYTRWVRDWWAFEVASIVLGIICILAIAMMLLKVDGKEMSHWQLGISIDALLSLLSGFSKSCLLMPTAEALGQLRWSFDSPQRKRAIDIERIDKASRGMWGSVVLLVRARGV